MKALYVPAVTRISPRNSSASSQSSSTGPGAFLEQSASYRRGIMACSGPQSSAASARISSSLATAKAASV